MRLPASWQSPDLVKMCSNTKLSYHKDSWKNPDVGVLWQFFRFNLLQLKLTEFKTSISESLVAAEEKKSVYQLYNTNTKCATDIITSILQKYLVA